MTKHSAGRSDDLEPGRVTDAGPWAVGRTHDGDAFAVSRRCRHLMADLANGTVDEEGCLVCPWHQSRYDPASGRMVTGPQGIFAKIPGLGLTFRALTRVIPLRRAPVAETDGELLVG